MRGLRGLRGVRGLTDAPAGGSKTPDEVANLWAWWKADAGITKDEWDQVTTWADQSGNSRDLGITDAPALWLDAQHGALPMLDFPGGETPAWMTLAAVPATGTGARCIMIAMRGVSTVGVGYNHAIHFGSDSAGGAYGLTTRSYTTHTGAGNDGVGNHYWGSGMADDADCPENCVLVAYFNGTTDTIRVNQTEVVSGEPTINTGSSVLRVGTRVTANDEYLSAKVGEIVVFSACPSLADIEAVEAYLYDRWVAA